MNGSIRGRAQEKDRTMIEQEAKSILSGMVGPVRAVIYARVSSDDSKTASIGDQIQICTDYCEAQSFSIVEVLAEDARGVSGASEDTPQLRRLSELAKSGLIDKVIFRDVTRFSRDMTKGAIWTKLLWDEDVTMRFVWEGWLSDINPTNELDMLKLQIALFSAQSERRKIVERLYNGRKKALRNGSVLNANAACYGYDAVNLGTEDKPDWRLEINESEAYWVRCIFEWFAAGETYSRIVQMLADNQVATPGVSKARFSSSRKKSNPFAWGKSTLRAMLENETYAGRFIWGKYRLDKNSMIAGLKELITVEVPVIISDELWRKVEARLLGHKGGNRSTKNKHKLLFAGHCNCFDCEIQAVNKHRHIKYKDKEYSYNYYLCGKSNARQIDYSCAAPPFTSAKVDKLAWQWIEDLLLSDDLGQYFEAWQSGQDTDMLEQKIELIEEQIARVKKVIGGLAVSLSAVEGVSETAREMLVDKIKSEESVLSDLKHKRGELHEDISQRLSQDIIDNAVKFAQKVREGLIDPSWDLKRSIIEVLQAKVELAVIDGEKMIRVNIAFKSGDDFFPLEYKRTRIRALE